MWRLIHKLNRLFRPERLTPARLIFAVAVAAGADGLQILFQVIPMVPEIIDVAAMLLTSAAIGFHLLLLPTFAVEFIPVVDMLPTWTGCVLAVILLRRREQNIQSPLPEATPPVIRVEPPPLEPGPPKN